MSLTKRSIAYQEHFERLYREPDHSYEEYLESLYLQQQKQRFPADDEQPEPLPSRRCDENP